MSPPRSANPLRTKSLYLWQSGAIVLLLGGIAFVVLALWQLSPPLPTTALPSGQLETRFRHEVSRVLSAVGIAAAPCQYVQKLLVLACTVPSSAEAPIVKVLLAEGWRSQAGPGSESAFTRDRDIARLDCRSRKELGICELSVRLGPPT